MAGDTQKPVRLVDIAKAADVSVSTVSLALSDHPRIGEETKRRLRQLSRKLGYRRPGESDRRNGRSQRSPRRAGKAAYRFGCLMIGSTLQDEVNMDLLDGLTSRSTDIDARMELGSIDASLAPVEGLEQAMRFAERLDGVIVSGEVSPALLAAMEEAHLPHVVLGHTTADPTAPLSNRTQIVTFDETMMGRHATRALLKAGHHRVAFVSEKAPKNLWSDRWLTGYRIAHLDMGLPIDEQLIDVSTPIYGNMGAAVGAMFKLKNPPTGVVVPDARVGRNVVDALKHHGVSVHPSDVVVGSWLSVARRHGVADLGLIQPDVRALAYIALDHLVRLCETPPLSALEIIVPFTTRNLPEPAEPSGTMHKE